MGTFGSEFWNVISDADTARAGLSARLDNTGNDSVTYELNVILNRAAGSVDGRVAPNGVDLNTRGGVVYFPAGIYRIRRTARDTRDLREAVTDPDVQVWPNVQLWFAPGAQLRLDDEVVVLVQGSIRAAVQKIFEVLMPTSPTGRRGRVIFRTSKVHELYPEWWGAGSYSEGGSGVSPAANVDALNDCITAAHTDRVFPGGAKFPVIPIVLGGDYVIDREIVIEDRSPLDLRNPDGSSTGMKDRSGVRSPRNVIDVGNPDGIVLYGRRATGSVGAVRFTFKAAPNFPMLPTDVAEGRALLRINSLHGSILDGISFDGGIDAAMNRYVPTCVQVRGPARSTVFRHCAFNSARDVLVQIGDYLIDDPRAPAVEAYGGRKLPRAAQVAPVAGVPDALQELSGGSDQTGLTFESCTFHAPMPANPGEIAPIVGNEQMPGSAYRLVGIVFLATNTLPMTLDQCSFVGPMAANIAAYGGAIVIRGGCAQNQLHPLPYQEPVAGEIRRDSPRGGVDLFIGDVPIVMNSAREGVPASSTTAVLVSEFQSQSNQFLDTFRHFSASYGRVAFAPVLLQGVSHNVTRGVDGRDLPAPPAIFWSGPGRWAMSTAPSEPMASATTNTGSAATLTTVGCTFHGPRPLTMSPSYVDVRTSGYGRVDREPSGVVVIDSLAVLYCSVGTILTNAGPVVYAYHAEYTSDRFQAFDPTTASPPPWLRLI